MPTNSVPHKSTRFHRPHVESVARRHRRGQALVELAIVFPVLVGIVAVLFQFGILFIAYLSLVHETRDIGRYVAVHPDTLDGSPGTVSPPCSSSPPSGSLWAHVCSNVPSVIDATKIKDIPLVTPACTTISSTTGHCVSGSTQIRTTGSEIHIQMSYDASSIIFLPTTFQLGAWLKVAIPTQLPQYDYYVMVEPH
jgi:TadE-like protein